jgi:hypothetical protein
MSAATAAHLNLMQGCAILQTTLNSRIEGSHVLHRRLFFHRIAVLLASASRRFRYILHNHYRHLQRFSSTPFIRRARTQRINGFSLGSKNDLHGGEVRG